MSTHQLLSQMTHSKAYEAEILHLKRSREKSGARADALSSYGLSLSAAAQQCHRLAKRLARTVRKGNYQFSPCRVHQVYLNDKYRTLYRFELTDTIVQGVLAAVVSELCRPFFSVSVYSYLKGLSSRQAMLDFSTYLRQHCLERPEVKTRGLYVLRRDISAYGESIPVDDASKLWSLLRSALLEHGGIPETHPLWVLLKQAIRPVVVADTGKPARLDVGVPTGSSIQPVMCNLYLTPLDRQLESISGGFYSRYGDDILFAHPDAKQVEQVSKGIDITLEELRLRINDQKRRDLYFTAAGRPSLDWPEARPCTRVEYLGSGISFAGQIELKHQKQKDLLKVIRGRLTATKKLLKNGNRPELARALCRVVNRTLDPRDTLSHSTAQLLSGVVNSRSELKHLDYLLALMVSEAATGIRGPRSFRQLSYRSLRREYKLVSLVKNRNTNCQRRGARQT